MARKAKKAVKKTVKRASRKTLRKAVRKAAKKTSVRHAPLRLAGVAAGDLPELPPEARALSRKYGSFW